MKSSQPQNNIEGLQRLNYCHENSLKRTLSFMVTRWPRKGVTPEYSVRCPAKSLQYVTGRLMLTLETTSSYILLHTTNFYHVLLFSAS